MQLEARWEGDAGLCDGQVSDISLGGCFILTDGRVKEKELVRIEVDLPNGDRLNLWGKVVEYSPEIGFSLCFTGLSARDEYGLELLVALTAGDGNQKKSSKRSAESITVRF